MEEYPRSTRLGCSQATFKSIGFVFPHTLPAIFCLLFLDVLKWVKRGYPQDSANIPKKNTQKYMWQAIRSRELSRRGQDSDFLGLLWPTEWPKMWRFAEMQQSIPNALASKKTPQQRSKRRCCGSLANQLSHWSWLYDFWISAGTTSTRRKISGLTMSHHLSGRVSWKCLQLGLRFMGVSFKFEGRPKIRTCKFLKLNDWNESILMHRPFCLSWFQLEKVEEIPRLSSV